jgi:predicted ATPase
MKFTDGRGSINAARMSHGNLIFLGLMVLTYTKNRPPVMLIEEPENGLTPAALKRFYQAVRTLAFRNAETERSQVLVSSHSPFVALCTFAARITDMLSCIATLSRRADGLTRARAHAKRERSARSTE